MSQLYVGSPVWIWTNFLFKERKLNNLWFLGRRTSKGFPFQKTISGENPSKLKSVPSFVWGCFLFLFLYLSEKYGWSTDTWWQALHWGDSWITRLSGSAAWQVRELHREAEGNDSSCANWFSFTVDLKAGTLGPRSCIYGGKGWCSFTSLLKHLQNFFVLF